MIKIYDIKERKEFLEEIAILTQRQWGNKQLSEDEYNLKIKKKIDEMIDNLNNPFYCKLILLDDDKLLGFVSIFPTDGKERLDLTPWYATMYVKEEYRGLGYSKILNEAILKETKKRSFKKIYLKTDLINYYEKFGFTYLEDLSNGEKLYFINLTED